MLPGQVGPGATLSSRWGYKLVPRQRGRQESRRWQGSLRSQIRQTCVMEADFHHNLITNGLVLWIPLQSPGVCRTKGASQELSYSAGGPGLSFPSGETIGSGESSYPSNAFYLSVYGARSILLPHSFVLGFSQWYLIHE